MQWQLQMVGTGAAFAKSYYNNNALISSGGCTLLIDCGITAPWSLHRMQVPMAGIQGVLVTHLHADHIGGLEEFALRMKYEFKQRPSLYIESGLIDTLWEHSLKAGLVHSFDGQLTLDSYFEVVPLAAGVRQEIHPGLSVELVRTKHYPNMPSYSIILNDSVFYTSDMTFDAALLEEIVHKRGCKTILHDCQLIGSGLVHTTLEELLSLPLDIQERIMLMHYGDTMPEFAGKTGPMQFVEQHRIYTFGT
ncbi:MBL fold metallo-hydrolase [Paenibacillus sp. HJGM_3]|uniref:MBL fold metallo-hydrolase n=1 Tax=Paenibacillus sp. HJGM_3 TaxID=3379816 RepID=UPI00385A80FA